MLRATCEANLSVENSYNLPATVCAAPIKTYRGIDISFRRRRLLTPAGHTTQLPLSKRLCKTWQQLNVILKIYIQASFNLVCQKRACVCWQMILALWAFSASIAARVSQSLSMTWEPHGLQRKQTSLSYSRCASLELLSIGGVSIPAWLSIAK